jgi:hypothetical protein
MWYPGAWVFALIPAFMNREGLDPDHWFRADLGRNNPFERALFRGGNDEVHFAVGLGLAFWTFQLDLAVDFSELVDTALLSFGAGAWTG